VLSTQRFATYLQARSHDRTHALTLYLWNIKISSAFLVPLHVLEVTLRNAIVEAIKGVHGDTWPWSEGFTRSLPDSPARNYSAKRDLQGCSRKHQTAGKIIADLKLVFWEKMLTARHQARLWDNSFYAVFPNTPQIPDSPSQNRADLRKDIEEIRKLRNRIAHHEPIFIRVLRADLDRMVRAIRWRCDTTADWLLGIDPVTPLLAKMP